MGFRPFRNWKADEVRRFAREHGFVHLHDKGDDEFWFSQKLNALFRIPARNETIILPTMMDMVRKSKISKKDWIKWKEQN